MNSVVKNSVSEKTMLSPGSHSIDLIATSKHLEVLDRKITFSTYKKRSQVTSETDSFLTITKAFEFRPDLVSYKVYSTPDYWWKILEFNGMMDIFDFKNGKNIRLPSNFV